MENRNILILYLPFSKAEDTIAWFWSGINIGLDKTNNRYIDYVDFYDKYRKRMCNQS